MRKSLAATALALTILSATGATAAYADAQVDGGLWDYGHNYKDVWSNYWHPSKSHGSSVIKNGQKFDSGCVGANVRSYASTGANWWDSVAEYYRFC
ncbi:hypothetical protein KEM60_02971 [Austwickia sp. TVS 96-490-7B]|uniref:lactococcin 972 family bacteriocin n=1 Tax=Austwickia sp. TVS 96-490-7B TaxID=2830843 RepID=UPI001C575333|nr:hypothetical protein [Austwickia sp. TVS 96-490-7B]